MNGIRGGRVTSYMDDIQPERSLRGALVLDRVTIPRNMGDKPP